MKARYTHRSSNNFCFILAFAFQLSAFNLLIAAEDPAAIAQNALRALPEGKWALSAILTTRNKSDNRSLEPDERLLTIEFQQLASGTHEVTYRSKNQEGKAEGIQLILPKDLSARNIQVLDLVTNEPIKEMQAPFLKSVFSIEDICLYFLSWKTQKLLDEEVLKDRPCWKIASYPPPSKTNLYEHVESWIDKEYQATLKATAYDQNGNVIKEFNVRSFQQLEDVWILKKLEINAPALKASSRLEILDAKKK